MDKVIEAMDNFMQPIKDFMVKNQNNPIVWLLLFGLGLFVFASVYRALQKEK